MHAKPRALALLLCALAPATVAGPVSAATPAQSSRLAVEIVHRAQVAPDGAVTVTLRARCTSTFQAFELNLSVTQGYASGQAFQLAPPAVLPCDGKPHRTKVTVAPDAGTFTAGRARVEVYVGFYDSVAGHDAEATDAEVVRVGRS